MSDSIRNFERHTAKLLAGRAGVFSWAALFCLTAIPHLAFSADKPKGQEISRVIAKEMDAAQKALKASQWADVIKNLELAEQKSPLTTYDKKTIYDFKGYAYTKLNNLKAAETAYEQAVATGGYSPEDLALTNRKLFSIAYSTQNYGKAIEYGKTIAESPTATPGDFANLTQLYYQQKDCKNEIIWADKAIAAYRKANEQPKEQLYQFKLICATDAGDNAATVADLYDLVRLTNKTTYWNNVIRVERQEERDDHNLLMIYRVMYDTNSMNADTDYMEMAGFLADGGLPGEAVAVLNKALSSGIVKDDHNKDRINRQLTAYSTRADTDKKTLPQQDAEAEKNSAGELAVKVGEVHYGLADYDGAIKLINEGLQKGQVKHLDEAYVYLGESQVGLKNIAEAKKAFSQLKTVPNISPRVLKLWELYSEKLGQAQN
jgi:tetratricopeptide (TPR) repeat protein